jgi:hypothetical protein
MSGTVRMILYGLLCTMLGSVSAWWVMKDRCAGCPDPKAALDYEIRSSGYLGASSWIVQPNRPLGEQDCKTHPSFPGQILCERRAVALFDWEGPVTP